MKAKVSLLLIFTLLSFFSRAQWNSQYEDYGQPVLDISMISNTTGYACQWKSSPSRYEIFRTLNGGSNWVYSATLNNIYFEAMQFSRYFNTGIIVGDSGKIQKTTDGINWNSVSSGTTNWLRSIDIVDASDTLIGTDTFFVAGDSTVLMSTDQGSTWQSIYGGAYNFKDVDFVTGQIGYVAGSSGIFKTTNGGSSWAQVSTINTVSIGCPSTNICYAATTDSIYKSSNGGSTWNVSAGAGYGNFMDIDAVDDSNVFVACTTFSELTVYKTPDGGANWEEQRQNPDTLEGIAIDMLDANNGWVVGNGGIYHTSNGGSTLLTITNINSSSNGNCVDSTIGYVIPGIAINHNLGDTINFSIDFGDSSSQLFSSTIYYVNGDTAYFQGTVQHLFSASGNYNIVVSAGSSLGTSQPFSITDTIDACDTVAADTCQLFSLEQDTIHYGDTLCLNLSDTSSCTWTWNIINSTIPGINGVLSTFTCSECISQNSLGVPDSLLPGEFDIAVYDPFSNPCKDTIHIVLKGKDTTKIVMITNIASSGSLCKDSLTGFTLNGLAIGYTNGDSVSITSNMGDGNILNNATVLNSISADSAVFSVNFSHTYTSTNNFNTQHFATILGNTSNISGLNINVTDCSPIKSLIISNLSHSNICQDSISNFSLTGYGLGYSLGDTIYLTSDMGDGSMLYDTTTISSINGDTGFFSISFSYTYNWLYSKYTNHQVSDTSGNISLVYNQYIYVSDCLPRASISGIVYADQDDNCIYDSATENGLFALIQISPTSSDSGYSYFRYAYNGEYSADVLAGEYKVTTYYLFSNGLVNQNCQDTHYIDFNTNFADTSGIDFGYETTDCPLMELSVNNWRRRRCFKGMTLVRCYNRGITAQENVKIKVQMPEHVIFISSNYSYQIDSDGKYIFDIGTVPAGSYSYINIVDSVACEADLLGLEQCVHAWLTPSNSVCLNTDSAWDGSNLTVSAECVESNIYLKVKNTGTGNMSTLEAIRVYANGMIVYTNNIKLDVGDSVMIQVNNNIGASIRLEADQTEGHPTEQTAYVDVTGCNINTGNYGIVSELPQHDEAYEYDVTCSQIVDSYDPNDKKVYPSGITANHYVKPVTRLEYQIRFQNTGTDTAFKVVIVDTLSKNLDISTIKWGAASHEYEVDISGEGQAVITFTFNDINLIDSATNEVESQGFVKFHIMPYSDLSNGTEIHNSADIYFDFNAPIRTNDAWITIHDTTITGPDIEVKNVTGIKEIKEYELDIVPNPFGNQFHISLPEEFKSSYEVILTDMTGRRISCDQKFINNHVLEFDGSKLNKGLYLVEIVNGNEIIGRSKVIKK